MSNLTNNKQTKWVLLNSDELNDWIQSKFDSNQKWTTKKKELGGASLVAELTADDGDIFTCLWTELPTIEAVQTKGSEIKAHSEWMHSLMPDATGMLVFWKFPCVEGDEVSDYFYFYNKGFSDSDVECAMNQLVFDKMVRNDGEI